MDLLNALLMLPTDGPFLENKNEVLKIVEEAAANYESLDHLKNRISGKYNTTKKIDVAFKTLIDLNMEEIEQKTQKQH